MVESRGGLSAPCVHIARIHTGDHRCMPHPLTGDDGSVGTGGDAAWPHPHRPEAHDAGQPAPWMPWGDRRC